MTDKIKGDVNSFPKNWPMNLKESLLKDFEEVKEREEKIFNHFIDKIRQ